MGDNTGTASGIEEIKTQLGELSEKYKNANDFIETQAEYIKDLEKASVVEYGIIIKFTTVVKERFDDLQGKKYKENVDVAVVAAKNVTEYEIPKKLKKDLKKGTCVRCVGPSIISILDEEYKTGTIHKFSERLSEDRGKIYHNDGELVLFINPALEYKKGDNVLVDPNFNVVLDNYGQTEIYKVKQEVGISWKEIGGLRHAKDEMIESIELPAKHSELYNHYKMETCKGVLLYGPPGCGKTLIAKACAGSLAKTFDAESINTGFIYVKGPEILSKWVGESEERIRSLFLRAKMHKQEHGYPAILFIDEADAILAARGRRDHSFMSDTVVPMFLAEMDGLDQSDAIVVLSTNRADTLDPAITRDGRIDKKIFVGRPGKRALRDIFKIYLKESPVRGDMTHLINVASDEIYAANKVFYNLTLDNGEKETIKLCDIVSGAMAANIVKTAKTLAVRRDIKTGKKTGITVSDLREAVQTTYEGNQNLNHEEVIQTFMAEKLTGRKVVKFDKVF